MWRATRRAAALLWAGSAAFADAPSPDCGTGVFEDVPYSYCVADPAKDDIRLWLIHPDGRIHGTFQRVDEALANEGRTLAFAMNGGMYHEDRSPVGLYAEPGGVAQKLVTAPGPGNFGMLPNGVFCLTSDRASVIESRTFADRGRPCTYATQSGPLMVRAGALHPRFIPDSSSRFIRNGVGVRPDGRVVFAISDRPVNFHRFARLFRDGLGTPDALYIDGKVSRIYAPALGRDDLGFPLGPIIGVTVPRPSD